MYKEIENYDKDEVRQAALDNLTVLLHKVSLSTAAKELLLYVPTLMRILDDKLDLQAIKYLTAVHIIGMCESNNRVKRILDDSPRGTAYYKHARHDTLAARKANGQGKST